MNTSIGNGGKYNMDAAVQYHYGKFPPQGNLDYSKLIGPLAKATDAIARFDQMLRGMHESEILLAPLRQQEAVISSRMEGTVSTMDEILSYEADKEEEANLSNYRGEVVETYLYSRALKKARSYIEDGRPIDDWLIRTLHQQLLAFGRGMHKAPGQYKTEQNYIVDKAKKNVLFVPIKPELLGDGMERLFAYVNDSEEQVLIKTAIAHLEFESLHPFLDGNGRIGRMLITLYLWKAGVIKAPHFYVSGYLEEQKDVYVDSLREASRTGDWTNWGVFFLEALAEQAVRNLKISEEIQSLYREMEERFREALASQWSHKALDFVFTQPIFRNSKFTRQSGIPSATAARFTRVLVEKGLLTVQNPASGQRSALYRFEPLMKLVRV